MTLKLPGFLRPATPPMFSHGLALERLKNLGFAPSTIYDIGAFHGVRDNPLTGAGLVVGLKRTGDSTRN